MYNICLKRIRFSGKSRGEEYYWDSIRKVCVVCLGLILFVFSNGTNTSAQLITINFDELPDGTPINHGTCITDAYPQYGVKFYCFGLYPDFQNDNCAYAYEDSHALSGSNVVGGRIIGDYYHFLNFWFCYGVAEFTIPTDYVSLYGVGDPFQVFAYDEHNELIGRFDSWLINHTRFLEIHATNAPIKKIEFGSWTGDYQTYFDDLTFNTTAEVWEVWVDDDWAGASPGDLVDGHIFGTDAFAKIQDGIDAVASPGTVHVAAGTYFENIVMDNWKSLRGGWNGDSIRPTVYAADPNTDTIRLINYTGTIEGLGVTGASSAYGINCIANGGNNTAQITDCKVYGNNIGIHINAVGNTDDCSPYIHENFIYSNTTRGIGNMMYSSATIEGNYIYENGSGSVGDGGIGNRDNSTATIINNIIYENDHIGISIRDTANPKIINNTVTGHNATDGAAIKVMQNESISLVVIVNNIITDNKYGLVSQFDQPCSGNDYNDVWNNSLSDYIGFTKGLNDISHDPVFVDPENGGYHLQPASPCIDAGTSEGAPDTDFEGDTRPQGAGYDIGADEVEADVNGNDQDDLIIEFGTPGIWLYYNDNSWIKLHKRSPEIITSGDVNGNDQDDLIIDFGTPGIWVYYNNTTWKKLHSLSPEIIAVNDIDGNGRDDLIVDFGPTYGIWVYYNNTSLTKLHPLSPEIIACGDIDETGQDDIIIDFGSAHGIWVYYNDTTWKKLHSLSPEIIACGDIDETGQDDLIIDFGDPYGIWIYYNDNSWTKLHDLSPEIIACGNMDGS